MNIYVNRQHVIYSILSVCFTFSEHTLAYNDSRTSEFGLVVQATSDWVYDGTTETREEPSIGVNGEWRVARDIFLGFEAHEATTAAELQRERSVAAYIGIDRAFGKDWYSALSLQHREFPGSGAEWDFTELAVQFAYKENWSLLVDYSPDYYERDTAAYGSVLSYTRNFNSSSYWSLQFGIQEQVDSEFIDYEYARFAVGLSKASLNIDLSYGWNSENGNILFGDDQLLSPQLLLQVSYRVK